MLDVLFIFIIMASLSVIITQYSLVTKSNESLAAENETLVAENDRLSDRVLVLESYLDLYTNLLREQESSCNESINGILATCTMESLSSAQRKLMAAQIRIAMSVGVA